MKKIKVEQNKHPQVPYIDRPYVQLRAPIDVHPLKSFDFGYALMFLKQGKKVARKGWNGKGQFVVYQKGYPNGIPCNRQTAEAWGINEGDLFRCEPYLQIRTADGSHAMWSPSVTDCLAEDWEVVE